MQRTHVTMRSTHPSRIDTLVAQMARDGWTLAPPWPEESGVANFTRPDQPGWTPPTLPPDINLPVRTTAGRGRWWPFTIALGGWVGLAAIAGVIVR